LIKARVWQPHCKCRAWRSAPSLLTTQSFSFQSFSSYGAVTSNDTAGPETISRQSQIEVQNGMNAVFPRLWRYCVALTGQRDWADDLAQTTCLRAIEQADKFEAGTHLDRWMFRMAQRVWLNELRSRKVRTGGGLVPVEEIDLPAGLPDSETNIFARHVLNQVNTLPEAQRQAVFLVYVEGYSYKEAAELMDIPIGTVMSRLATARRVISDRVNADKGAAE
jgi:RNA polymerase sigma-70 factor (ECF subfamily)